MGLEVAVLAGATAQAVESFFDALMTDAGSGVSGYVKSALKRWQTDRTLRRVCERSKQIRRVKTIWQVEKEVDLLKFYYPSKIKSSTEPAKVVHRLQDFSFDGNLVVRGTVGQGKSTFLRYLAARELELSQRLPVFIELRRLGERTVVEAAIAEMENLGLEGANPEIFEYLAKSSRLVLLLDGFDEVTDEQASAIVQEVEDLSMRLPSLRMVVTSRPENAIERSPHFRVFDLAPLGPTEFPLLIERITRDPKLSEEIANSVNKSQSSIAKLLTTPLMVSLLVVRFRVGQGVPENRIAFYEPLFRLLLERHDTSKAGFKRKRKSTLSDSQLLDFFNCLCFVTRRDGSSVLRESALHAAAAKALKWINFTTSSPDAAVADIHKITCLILKDGLDEYRFLHKSVQEFHAACFVRDQPDALSSDFYTSMQQRWSDWEQELLFLRTIHPDRYDRYFAIPMLDQVTSTLVGSTPRELGRALISRLSMRVMLRPHPEFQNIVYPRDPVGWCLTSYFEGSSLFEGMAEASVRLARAVRQRDDIDYCDIPGHQVLEALAPQHHGALDAESEELGSRVMDELTQRKRRMHTVEERKGLFDI
jgi:PII-like signaling protein